MQPLPPLPKIEGDVDLILDVFTHSSLKGGNNASMNDDYGDTDRLAELGSHILDLAVTFHYYSRRPMLTAESISSARDKALSNDNIKLWLEQYGLLYKLRYAPGSRDEIHSPQEIRRFFSTYVGALQIRNGNATVQDWISRLIDPEAPDTNSMQYMQLPPADTSNGQPPWPATPAPPASPPPPLPSNTRPAASLISLATVNQVAAQRGIVVTYKAESTGPPHLPTWTVRCMMNGVEQGSGSGNSQKKAKEEAARQAYFKMGWGAQ